MQSLLLIKTLSVASDWRDPEQQLIEKTEAKEARDNKTLNLTAKKVSAKPILSLVITDEDWHTHLVNENTQI